MFLMKRWMKMGRGARAKMDDNPLITSAKQLRLLQGGSVRRDHDHFWESDGRGEDEHGPYTHKHLTNVPILFDPKDFPNGTIITIEVP